MTDTEHILSLVSGPEQATELINALLSRYQITFTASVMGRVTENRVFGHDLESIDLDVMHELTGQIRKIWATGDRDLAEFLGTHHTKIAEVILDRHPKYETIACVVEGVVRDMAYGQWCAQVIFDGASGRFIAESPRGVLSSVVDAKEWVDTCIVEHAERPRGYELILDTDDDADAVRLVHRLA